MNYYIIEEYRKITSNILLYNYTKQYLKSFDDIVIAEDISSTAKYVDYIKKRVLFETRHIFSDFIKEILEKEKGYIDSRAVYYNQ